MEYHFEWDPVKAKTNLQKHGVSFEESTEVFLDPLQLSMPDDEQPELEERWITLGNTKAHKLQLVVHTFITYHQDQIKDEYDFTSAERGRFYRTDVQLNIPVYLDQDVESWFAEKAKLKGVNLQSLINELLRKDISLIQEVTGKG
jgi:uncharacterized DUF497 family protein